MKIVFYRGLFAVGRPCVHLPGESLVSSETQYFILIPAQAGSIQKSIYSQISYVCGV